MNERIAKYLPLLALLLLPAANGCSRPAATAEENVVRIVNVETTNVTTMPFSARARITGTVEALHDVTIVAEEGGVVEDILVDRGDRVRKGQILARLDADVLTAQLDEARSSATLASEQWERRKRLWEEQKIGTELEYIQARETALMRAATVRVLEARLEKKTIRSPVAGNFEDYFVEVGEFAPPMAQFGRVISLDRVKLTGGVPERFAGEISVGSQVEVRFDALPGRTLDAHISFVGDAVEAQARTFPIEVQLSNPEGQLKPGMIANMSIIRRQIPAAVVIPQEAVIRSEDGYQVFVLVRDGERLVARARQVILGPSQSNRVVILEGLEGNEQLVTVGQLKLGDGDVVNVVNGGGEGR